MFHFHSVYGIAMILSFLLAFQDEQDLAKYPNGTSLLLPNGEQGRLIMDNNPDMYNRSRLPNDFDRYFAVSISS